MAGEGWPCEDRKAPCLLGLRDYGWGEAETQQLRGFAAAVGRNCLLFQDKLGESDCTSNCADLLLLWPVTACYLRRIFTNPARLSFDTCTFHTIYFYGFVNKLARSLS